MTSANKSPILIGLIAASAGFAGLAAVVKSGSPTAPGPLKPQFENAVVNTPPAAPPARPVAPKPRGSNPDTVRFAAMKGESPALSGELELKPGEDPRERSLAETVRRLGYEKVRILGVDVQNGTATVDTSSALLDLGLGSGEESALVQALALTLGQFPDVKSFRLRVDGEIVDTLGHLELAEGTPVVRAAEPSADETPARAPNP